MRTSAVRPLATQAEGVGAHLHDECKPPRSGLRQPERRHLCEHPRCGHDPGGEAVLVRTSGMRPETFSGGGTVQKVRKAVCERP